MVLSLYHIFVLSFVVFFPFNSPLLDDLHSQSLLYEQDGFFRCQDMLVTNSSFVLSSIATRSPGRFIVTQISIPKIPMSGSYFTPGISMCSFRPKAKLPRSSNDDLEILLSITGRTFLRKSIASCLRKVTTHAIGSPLRMPKSRMEVLCVFLNWSLSSNLF